MNTSRVNACNSCCLYIFHVLSVPYAACTCAQHIVRAPYGCIHVHHIEACTYSVRVFVWALYANCYYVDVCVPYTLVCVHTLYIVYILYIYQFLPAEWLQEDDRKTDLSTRLILSALLLCESIEIALTHWGRSCFMSQVASVSTL